eukprot:CAMPEP_0194317894 /NCGR_PEP_ID=MMETSP0171-20130528/14576_1 /TAXON_ID=218684 /ORGANISM="Corethron pennatum, Strain L29A3" /LENGTH=758 /DNA_ID=CAMNT_0039074625 /DNA_START=403 /DNA_END=2679 /DNA_ORIENTATION=+
MDHTDPMEAAQTMGIVNALKTGNITLDMLIAMCIPVFLRFAFSLATGLFSFTRTLDWSRWLTRHTRYYERTISQKTVRTAYGGVSSLDGDTKNSVLVKALQHYVDQECRLQLRTAELVLSAVQSVKERSRYYYYSGDEDEGRTLHGTLSKYSLVTKPPHRVWHHVGSYGAEGAVPCAVELYIDADEDEEGEKESGVKHCTLNFYLRSTGEGSVDSFVNGAYRWYLDELLKLEDNARHLYELQVSPGAKPDDDDNGVNGDREYKRYKLSDEKTFDSLFFPEKESLLNLVEHFKNKTGKYGIKGYPHKLGLLLYGPPGTGKTSLIKALAKHTGRSIVNIPLNRISTNAELMSLFFDQRYHVTGQEASIQLGFKDVIYVMEDVDASSKIVRRRDGKKTAAVTRVERVDLPTPKSLWAMLLQSSDDDCKALVEKLTEHSERLRAKAQEPSAVADAAARMAVLPGLGIVGEACGGEAGIAQAGSEALERAREMMDEYATVDSFLGAHARVLVSLVDKGAPVDKALEDLLLGVSQPLPRSATEGGGQGHHLPSLLPPKKTASRNVSYTKNYKDEQFKLQGAVSNMMEVVLGGQQSSAGQGTDKIAFGPPENNWLKPKKDDLNLTGLLNTLDGVVDTPGRILIMTTNHPEMLDPALIRPGRIDKKMCLGYMTGDDILGLIGLYFPGAAPTEEQARRVRGVVRGGDCAERPAVNLTPAQVEQLAAEHDEVEGLVAALEEKQGQSLGHPDELGPRVQVSGREVSFSM